jgi:uncharacterized membrane protein YeaQ/YmgE (transglycosylase-associated protein family)
MNTIIWILAGAALAWIAFSYLQLNLSRGLVIAIVIGALSAYVGGSVLAPLFSSAVHAAGEFRPFALLVASATAVACVYISDVVYERFGV